MKTNHWIVFENKHDYELEKAKKKEEESLYEIKKENKNEVETLKTK